MLQTASTTAAHASSSTGFQMVLACECRAHSGAWWYVHVKESPKHTRATSSKGNMIVLSPTPHTGHEHQYIYQQTQHKCEMMTLVQ